MHVAFKAEDISHYTLVTCFAIDYVASPISTDDAFVCVPITDKCEQTKCTHS